MKIKSSWITILVVIAVAVIAYFIITKPQAQTPTEESIAKCIGQNSLLYVQTGCSHCTDQENLFGNNFKYINSTDCLQNSGACNNNNITATPTWIIKGKEYIGVQSIKTLQNLTGC